MVKYFARKDKLQIRILLIKYVWPLFNLHVFIFQINYQKWIVIIIDSLKKGKHKTFKAQYYWLLKLKNVNNLIERIKRI